MKYTIEKKVNGKIIPQEIFDTKKEAINRFYKIISLGNWCYNLSYFAWIPSKENPCISVREMQLIKL